MARNVGKDLKKAINPAMIGDLIKGVTMDSGGMTPQFMEKVTANQMMLQENQIEFEAYLKKILENQKEILKKLK